MKQSDRKPLKRCLVYYLPVGKNTAFRFDKDGNEELPQLWHGEMHTKGELRRSRTKGLSL